MSEPEAWLRGPVTGVHPLLMPVAHAFVQVVEDLDRLKAGLDDARLWAEPGGAASVGFHLRHLAGATDRLLTYARGEQLSEAQLEAMKAERLAPEPRPDADALAHAVREVIERALEQVRETPPDALASPREVGRARLRSTVIGLLFHAAEHATRHAGQIATLVKIVRAQHGRES